MSIMRTEIDDCRPRSESYAIIAEYDGYARLSTISHDGAVRLDLAGVREAIATLQKIEDRLAARRAA